VEPGAASTAALLELIPFAGQLGIELLEATPDLVRGRLAWAPDRTTTADAMHATNSLRAITGGAATATTRPLHRGRTLLVLETEVARDDDKLAAKVTQTQTYLYPRG